MGHQVHSFSHEAEIQGNIRQTPGSPPRPESALSSPNFDHTEPPLQLKLTTDNRVEEVDTKRGIGANLSGHPNHQRILGAFESLGEHRFIVAPGENLLTTGNDGGVTRQSGTSFAAPLVTGAVALLQTRWPWLAQYPKETTSIILSSASYKGDRGNYGVGILNIAASQEPLNWEKVSFYAVTNASVAAASTSGASGPLGTKMSVSDVVSTITATDKAGWEANGLYFSVFEKVGNTYRDFQIPLSSKLVGQNVGTDAGQQLFQSFITGRLINWAKWKADHPPTTFANAADATPDLMDGHALDFASTSVPIGQIAGLEARV